MCKRALSSIYCMYKLDSHIRLLFPLYLHKYLCSLREFYYGRVLFQDECEGSNPEPPQITLTTPCQPASQPACLAFAISDTSAPPLPPPPLCKSPLPSRPPDNRTLFGEDFAQLRAHTRDRKGEEGSEADYKVTL